MTNTTIEQRVRMFIVEGLPNKNIPVPPQDVMEAYLEGNDRQIREYLRELLTEPHVTGSYTVSVDPDIVRDHLHKKIDRVSTLSKTLMALLDDLSSIVEGPDYEGIRDQVESVIIEYVPTTILRIYTGKDSV